MHQLSLRGIFAPLFMALAIAAGFIEFWLSSRSLLWLGLGFLALGIGFARDTHRLLLGAQAALRGDSVNE